MDVLNSYSLTGVCAALAEALGVEKPAQAAPALEPLRALVKDAGGVDRIFMYNPDAIAMWLWQKYTYLFEPVARHTQLALPLRTVMPSVTPVCFGTFYTGAEPSVHGIRSYSKPVIRIDTLFDALIRAGKRCAIVGDTECSLCHIYLERDMDVFSYDTIDEINRKGMELIEEDRHDLIIVYNGNYDETMHKNGTETEPSMNALKANIAAFDAFAEALKEKWAGHRTLLGFAMDHGCHDIDGGCGSHGLDMPEDLNIVHHYGIL